MAMQPRAAADIESQIARMKAGLERPDIHKDQAWLETMLAYAVNLLSQSYDQLPADAIVTTGPDSDPDMFDIHDFMTEVRKFYPRF